MPILSAGGDNTGGPGPPPVFGPRADWQFILGPAAGGWVTPLTQATGKTITWRLTDAHDASFTVNATAGLDAGITPLATDLHVLYGGQPVYRGRITDPSDQISGGQHYATFASMSYRGILNRRQLYSTSQLAWVNTDVAQIVWGLVRQTQTLPGGQLGIVQGLGFPALGQVTTKTVQAGDQIAAKIDDLAYVDIGGFDWDITPQDQATQTLDLWAAGHGTDKGVVLQYGDGLTGSDWQRTVDTSVFADALIMSGGTPTSGNGPTPVEVTTAGIATRAEGRWDATFQSDELSQSLLQARAALQLNGSSLLVPSYTIPLQPGKWGGPDHLWIGDTIHISLNSGRFTGTLETMRVLELAADVGQDVTQVTITAGAPRPDLRRQLARLVRELRKARHNRAAGRNLRPGYLFISA